MTAEITSIAQTIYTNNVNDLQMGTANTTQANTAIFVYNNISLFNVDKSNII